MDNTRLQQGKLNKLLNKRVIYYTNDGQAKILNYFELQQYIIKLEIDTVPKYRYNRRNYNQMDYNEQRQYEKKLLETKQVYRLYPSFTRGSYTIPKMVYEFYTTQR